jgi:hypothetical protein
MSGLARRQPMTEHTSKDLSKRLANKGFRGEHKNVWVIDGDQYSSHGIGEIADEGNTIGCETIPAYTFTEIWGALPYQLVDADPGMPGIDRLELYKYPDVTVGKYGILASVAQPNPAEAAGLLLEWLIDNGHIARTALQEGKDG